MLQLVRLKVISYSACYLSTMQLDISTLQRASRDLGLLLVIAGLVIALFRTEYGWPAYVSLIIGGAALTLLGCLKRSGATDS